MYNSCPRKIPTGKGLAQYGLILMIVGFLPVLASMSEIAGLEQIMA
ncbi:MAG: hypothetical protein ACTSYX_02990 [Candidatus Thorarchaeota archaeon]